MGYVLDDGTTEEYLIFHGMRGFYISLDPCSINVDPWSTTRNCIAARILGLYATFRGSPLRSYLTYLVTISTTARAVRVWSQGLLSHNPDVDIRIRIHFISLGLQ